MRISTLILCGALLAVSACGDGFDRETGGDNTSEFGNATMNNTLIQSGQKEYTMQLAGRFAREVPSTITFAFNSSQLDGNAVATLRQQADWIKTFPEVRFRVYGHTDLVGSNASNQALGLRRAQAVVAFFASQGISRNRLEAMASYGETRPVVQTPAPEERNRRTVTEVSGFVKNHPALLNGKYAAVIHREYLVLAERAHPSNQVIATQTSGN
ncbi:OmpA family protein [Pseudorhodobacter sp. W20_MBD10_FR17]|uniref:OmpA family protein n=1 Tax=Pseudorhodobacter sp. W20_MBD10_FR17 TaxID=3240266 RepID=UPI003F9C47A4